MTIEAALAKLEFLENEKKKSPKSKNIINAELNALFAPVAKRSQKIELRVHSLIDVLLALIANTEYNTEIVICSAHLLAGRPHIPNVFVFGKDPGRFNVWFQKRLDDGKQILCVSLKSPGF